MQTFLPSVRHRTKCFYGLLLRQIHNLTRLSRNALVTTDTMHEQPRGKPRGIKTKDNGKSVRPKGRGIGPGEIQQFALRDSRARSLVPGNIESAGDNGLTRQRERQHDFGAGTRIELAAGRKRVAAGGDQLER